MLTKTKLWAVCFIFLNLLLPTALLAQEAENAAPQSDAQATPVEIEAQPADEAQQADEAEDPNRAYYELRNTLDEVLNTLVEQEIIDREKADAIASEAIEKAEEQIQEETRPRKLVVEETPPPPTEKVIRVPYVPEHVKQQIRDQVRSGLREDTVDAVLGQAKLERWGMPGVLPTWVDRIKWKGDVRLRAQKDNFDEGNLKRSHLDYLEVNDAGGRVFTDPDDLYLNTTENRERLRVRARLSMDAKLDDSWRAGFRLTTGKTSDPVSTNQTLGNDANRYNVVWDRAYINYNGYNEDRYNNLTMWGGRIPNPWLSSDLVWDSDLGFEGVAATYRMNLRGSGSLLEMTEQDRTLFFTVGAFPLKEFDFFDDDKWLYGAQVGSTFQFVNQSELTFGVAYYDYVNITGRVNRFASDDLNYRAPDVLQKGNTLFNVRNEANTNIELFALASDYDLVNLTARLDLTNFAPHRLTLTADYVENLGFDKTEIEERLQGRTSINNPNLEEKTKGYQFKAVYGWPRVTLRGNWRVSIAYKYLERDAVLDAFTDSDFNLGGTDAKGIVVGGDYGLADNVWVSARILRTHEVEGPPNPPFGVEIVQLDLNLKF
jgi:hypothetical protein